MRILIAGYPEKTRNYCEAITAAGMEAIVCTDVTSPLPDTCDGLLLPGGGDIDPPLFGEKDHGSKNIDRTLDLIQFALLERFLKAGRPVLGICKGMQVINVHFGGGIIQHLPTAKTHAWDSEDKLHPVTVHGNSFLAPLYGERFMVNSAHHQGIGRPGRDLRITLFSDDQVPEAIEHTSLPVIGLQFHPERLCGRFLDPKAIDGSLIFRHFASLFVP